MLLDFAYIIAFVIVAAVVYLIFWKTRTVDHDSLRSVVLLASSCQKELEYVKARQDQEQRASNHELLLLELEVSELRQIVADITGSKNTLKYEPRESRTALYNYLNDSFSDDQISSIYFNMNYDEDKITGRSIKPKKIRDLIMQAERDNEVIKLRDVASKIKG